MVYFQSPSDTNRKEINTHRRPQIGKLVSVGRFRFVYVFTFRKTVWFLASKKPAIFPINIFILYQNKSIHLSSEGTTRGCSFAKSFFLQTCVLCWNREALLMYRFPFAFFFILVFNGQFLRFRHTHFTFVLAPPIVFIYWLDSIVLRVFYFQSSNIIYKQ